MCIDHVGLKTIRNQIATDIESCQREIVCREFKIKFRKVNELSVEANFSQVSKNNVSIFSRILKSCSNTRMYLKLFLVFSRRLIKILDNYLPKVFNSVFFLFNFITYPENLRDSELCIRKV